MARDDVCSSYCYAANLLSRTGTKRKYGTRWCMFVLLLCCQPSVEDGHEAEATRGGDSSCLRDGTDFT